MKNEAQVTVIAKDGKTRYQAIHKAHPTESPTVTARHYVEFTPPLPAVTNGETLKVEYTETHE